MEPDLLSNLNPQQKSAVTHDAGPMLIVAGAGTGKTTVLINRLAYLVLEKKIPTDEILIMTFTEKATSEMTERADKILPYGYFDLWINTFHGFCERVLREHALDIGLNPDFKLLSQTEQWILIKKNLKAFDLDYYRPLGNPTKFIHEMIHHFSRLKDEDIKVEDYIKHAAMDVSSAESFGGPKEEELENKKVAELAGAYQVYNQLLLDNGFFDFGDLIVYTLKLFKERPNILKLYRDKFKYVMVDEFQDTNFAQYELVKMLAAPQNNLMVVGDDDQAIYKFRGASLSNIMQFKDDYPSAVEVILVDNYRSNQEILDGAYNFIKHNNPNRLEEKLKIDKKLVAHKNSEGKAIEFLNFAKENQAVSFVVDKIKELYQLADVTWSDFAILVRANDHADKYLKELRRQDIAHQFVSLQGLYYKPIILDIISYLKLLDNFHESRVLYRVLNMNIFKVSYLDLVNINKMARQKVWSLYEALKNIEVIPNISPEAVVNVNKLLVLLDAQAPSIKTDRPSKIFLRFIYDSQLLKNLDHDVDRETFSFINQFYQKIKEFEVATPDLRLNDFVEMLDLELEAGESGRLKMDFSDSDVVKVMTIHGAKGLEFKYVFVVDMVDKRFPTIARGEKISIPDALVKEILTNSKDIHLEEERRLFYVAATRAKDQLFLIAAKDCGGARDKKPSRFISEIGLDDSVVVNNDNVASDLARDLAELDEPVKAIKQLYELPERFSFSQLAAFSKCPLQYKFAFVLRVPVPSDKASLIFGKVIHSVLQEFVQPLLIIDKSKIDKTKLSVEKILEIYQAHFVMDGYKDKEERENYYQKGYKIVSDFAEKLNAAKLPQILFLEKEFNFKIGEYSIKGAIDRIDALDDDTLEIVDYKTGKPKEKLEADDKKQLMLYQLFLEDFMKKKVSTLSYYYLESGEKISFTTKEKDLAKLREDLLAEMNEIRKLNFPPKPSILCGFCDFNGICEFRDR
ncbi:MAG: ATP-dependent DNA helicase [Candidatus Falkowbacteria bacterium]